MSESVKGKKLLKLITWESIGSAIKRAAVPGGWLVRCTEDTGGIAFVPDPKHKWKENCYVQKD